MIHRDPSINWADNAGLLKRAPTVFGAVTDDVRVCLTLPPKMLRLFAAKTELIFDNYGTLVTKITDIDARHCFNAARTRNGTQRETRCRDGTHPAIDC